jgi:prepilin-type N-terminal cleavage/methylation domain-containing protein/prepilin-type processing-associated H-X9-DG protein
VVPTPRRKGFTLIELLVVISIIAILAAMLFPVFARARESARKIQCLSNVKNIAMALQMYLSDYDRFPPSEHRAEVKDYIINQKGQGDWIPWMANPYLRWPVILDEYIKNRDIWRCPSAKSSPTFAVNPCIPDWFTAAKNGMNGCNASWDTGWFPPGWGGTITDSFVQTGVCAGADTSGFESGYGVTTWHSQDEKMSQVNDPSKKVIVGDAGRYFDVARTSWIAYPDICRLDGAGCGGRTNQWSDNTCVSCDYSFIQGCGAYDKRFGTDPTFRKEHAAPRHLGGSNLGFADGHAAWMPSEAILFGGDQAHGYGRQSAPLEGLEVCGVFYP